MLKLQNFGAKLKLLKVKEISTVNFYLNTEKNTTCVFISLKIWRRNFYVECVIKSFFISLRKGTVGYKKKVQSLTLRSDVHHRLAWHKPISVNLPFFVRYVSGWSVNNSSTIFVIIIVFNGELIKKLWPVFPLSKIQMKQIL